MTFKIFFITLEAIKTHPHIHKKRTRVLHLFKNNSIIFIIISLITLNVQTSELNNDLMLLMFKDIPYRDIISLTVTNKYYNATINASFYAKMICNITSSLLQFQLSLDESLFNTFYRIQTKRHAALIASEQSSETISTFGLNKLFAINSSLINKLIIHHIQEKYTNNGEITINSAVFNLDNITTIPPKEFILDEQILFFSDSQHPTKYEQGIIALPLLIEKIEKKEIGDVQELLKVHDQFNCISPWKLLEPLCALGNYSIVKKFIEDKSFTDELSNSALEHAHSTGSLPLFTDLLNNLNNNNCDILCYTLAKILKKCIDHEQIDWVRTIVQCEKYNKTVKQKLVNRHFEDACKNSTGEIIELLLPYGPLEHAAEVALVAACNNYNTKLIHWLIDKQNANVNYLYKDGQTILEYFLINQKNYWHDETILIFLQKANITLVNKNKQTLLHLALKNNQKDVARILLDKGANVNCVDCSNKNSLHYAMENGNHYSTEMLELLLEKGADVNGVDIEGIPPLAYAFSYPADKWHI